MAACSLSVEDDSRVAFYGPTPRKVLVACCVLLQGYPPQFWNHVLKVADSRVIETHAVYHGTICFRGSSETLLG
jgi:hypothetical protein